MFIKGLVRQWEGGGYYRIKLPLAELERQGHRTEVAWARSDIAAEGADLIVGQMIGSPDQGQSVVHRWWRGLKLQCPRVYEMDDDPFEIEPTNPVYEMYATLLSKDSLMHCIQLADLVTVSVDPLAERIAKINPRVVVLKNRIDESMLSLQRIHRDGRVVIGWAGGCSHGEDMKEAAYGVRSTLKRCPGAEFHMIGVDYRPMVRGPVERMRYTRWAAKTTDYYELIDFDIGIAPLRPTLFAQTKSAIKALEYGALGIPVVASDVAPYRDFVIDGVTGWLVRRPHEWAARLTDLVNDEAMRTEMGQKAKEVVSEWTIQKGWREWAAAYQSLL